mmetsp:Transcript_9583/g.22379  ORF Transcript_9583/g.22379 Transcript_9583/m.22379 type:complete len:216 (+) Transcript_9583:766-1413(+)
MTAVLRLFTAKLTPLMQFPISIPQIGMMYCGSQRGVGLMTTRKANVPTSGTVISRAARVATPAYLNVYFGLEIDSRAPTQIMKETYKKTSHGQSNPFKNMGVRTLPSTMSCAKHRASPTRRWLSMPSSRRWAAKAKHSRGVAATSSKGTETGTTPFACTVARCRMSDISLLMRPRVDPPPSHARGHSSSRQQPLAPPIFVWSSASRALVQPKSMF